jgi:curved DNA-binding protein CbpA
MSDEPAEKDWYAILGVAPTATPEEIKRAYRRKISEAHSDTNGGDDELAKDLNCAKDVLLDPERRAKYDTARRRGGTNEDRLRASEQISSLFSLWLERDDAEWRDPLEIIRDSLTDTLKRIEVDRQACRDRLSRLNRLMTRVKYVGPEGDNIFQGVITAQLGDVQEQLEHLDEQLRIANVVQKLVLEYEFNPGAMGPMPTPWSGLDMGTEFRQSIFFIDLNKP